MATAGIQRGAILERTWNSTTRSVPEDARRRAASASNSASESAPVPRSSASRDNFSDRSEGSPLDSFSDSLGISEEGLRNPVGVLGPPAEVPLSIPLSPLIIPLNIPLTESCPGAAIGALLPEDDEDESEDEGSSS